MKALVVRHKILTYSEFLNLEPWELAMMVDSMDESEREAWERSRFNAYITAQTQSTKKLKPTDIIRFKWDDEKPHEKTTKEQFEEYKRQMGYK